MHIYCYFRLKLRRIEVKSAAQHNAKTVLFDGKGYFRNDVTTVEIIHDSAVQDCWLMITQSSVALAGVESATILCSHCQSSFAALQHIDGRVRRYSAQHEKEIGAKVVGHIDLTGDGNTETTAYDTVRRVLIVALFPCAPISISTTVVPNREL
jgi:hypothetical protein